MNHPLIAASSFLIPFFPSIARWITEDTSEKFYPQGDTNRFPSHGQTKPFSNSAKLFGSSRKLTQFQKSLIEIEKECLMEEILDRQRARNRDVALFQTGRQNLRADIMVIAAALGLAACLLILAFYRENLPGEAVGIISTVAGIFGSCLKDAYAFEFGSPLGSKDKDQHVSTILHQWK